MLNLRTLVSLLVGATVATASTAQHVPDIYCTTHDHERIAALNDNDPVKLAQIAAAEAELEAFTEQFAAEADLRKGGGAYVIPVVFHIIHNNGPENISNEQVIDAVRGLNDDFNRLNDDWDDVRPEFLGIVADVGVTFKLAQKDPNGDCTNGITRTISPLTNAGDQDMKDLIQWPRNKYLNVWVAASADGAAGYTYTPGSVANQPTLDGIVLLHDYTGSIGTSQLSHSRTLTHEVGHWINLRHVWGPTNEPGLDDNCNETDNVSDTPPTEGWTSCNLNGNTCTAPLDNVENYMEYSYCSKMFTAGQKTRMIAALNSNTAQRNQLWTPANLISTGVDVPGELCAAVFTSNVQVVCAGDPVAFTDMSFNNVSAWDWAFPGAVPTVSTDTNPTVVYSTPGMYDVTLTAGDGNSTVSNTEGGYILVLPATGSSVPVVEGFENVVAIPGNEWTVYNPNSDEAFELTTAAAYSGSKSTRLRNYTSQATNIDELHSGTYDMSNATDITISWRYSFARRNSDNDDLLRLYVSNDCGATWNMRRQLRGATDLPTVPDQNSQFIPTNQSQWEWEEVSNILTSYHVADFRFKFWFQSDGGNNIYLDDINITSGPVGINELSGGSHDMLVVPDPVVDAADLVFTMDKGGPVEIDVLDALGRVVAHVHSGNLAVGDQRITLPVTTLGAGLYFARVQGNGTARAVRFAVR
ncbi:MAG: PKD domain-containing protein [Flavobacteriales bacterium]|nr:PKD domain-containing protein [Flavobacteriales bacterium]